jgi:hypothetical protein
LESLDRKREGIYLLSVKVLDGVTTATLFVHRAKVVNLLRLIERYEKEDSTKELKDGTKTVRPKHQKLVESIASIRLLAIADLWQEESALFPQVDQRIWWEVWARRGDGDPASAYTRLAAVVQAAGLTISPRYVHFPERLIALACGTANQLAASVDLLSSIAELRLAKEVPTDYIGLPARDQREFARASGPKPCGH